MRPRNEVRLEGSLARDPELRYLMGRKAVVDFQISVRRTLREQRKGRTELPDDYRFDVTLFGEDAELCAEYLKKGSRVLIMGRLVEERWELCGWSGSRVKILGRRVEFPERIPTGPSHGTELVSETIRPLVRLFRDRLKKMSQAEAAAFLSAAVDPFLRVYERHRQSLSNVQASLWPPAGPKPH